MGINGLNNTQSNHKCGPLHVSSGHRYRCSIPSSTPTTAFLSGKPTAADSKKFGTTNSLKLLQAPMCVGQRALSLVDAEVEIAAWSN